MSKQTKQLKYWLRQGVAASLLAILAACGTVSPPENNSMGSGYLLTVKISSSDTQSAIAQKYGGQAISWQPDAGFAILKMSNQAVAQLKNSGISMQGTTLDTNLPVSAPAKALGWNVWAGGWNTWAGGWNTWAGGWNTWAGGTSGGIPAIPSDNRYEFLQTKLPQAQTVARNYGTGIKVAVIDTGVDTTHPIFTGRLAPAAEWKDFVDGDTSPMEVQPASGQSMYGHGTAVAGIVVQSAPLATILPIRALGPDGSGDLTTVVSAIDWAIQKGANVINLSLGASSNAAALQTEIELATSQGIYVVASAGNTGDANVTFPAALAKTAQNNRYLISVGSVDRSNALSSFSTRGPLLEFMAPGEQIYSAYPNSQIGWFTGTSFAAPQVSGAIALALSDTAAAYKGSLESYLGSSAQIISGNNTGYGLINIVGALQRLPDFQRKKALLVVNNTIFLANSELALKSRLESLGYTVTLVGDLASSASDATGKDVVLIPESVDALYVGNKFRSVSTPVVVWEADIFDDMNMTNWLDFGTSIWQTQVAISNSTHPLAAGLTGTQTIFAALNTLTYGRPAASAIKAATLAGDPNKAVVFGYDKGAIMAGSYAAPGRRVGLFLNANADQVNSMGGQLLESAVTWAVSGN